jgi:hypothetical protein
MTEFFNTYSNYEVNKNDIYPLYVPIFVSTTKACLIKEGFLSSAAFQQTKQNLSTAALEGTTDWFFDMKGAIIAGKKLSTGSSFLTSKFNLDNIYYYAKFNNKLVKN